MNGRRTFIWAALALFVVALPACEKPAEVAKTKGEPEAELTFLLDEEAALEARVEEARRRFLLAKTDEERQRALAELNGLDPDEAWDLQHSTAEDMDEERAEAAAEEARRRFLLVKTYEERQRALAELKRLDIDEVDDLACRGTRGGRAGGGPAAVLHRPNGAGAEAGVRRGQTARSRRGGGPPGVGWGGCRPSRRGASHTKIRNSPDHM